jgi:hypothetical protein
MKLRLCLTLLTALALAACGGDAKKETGGKAGGEILPASVSDEMLPRDTVRSQAPLAPKAESSEGGKDKPKAKPGEPDQVEDVSEPAPAEPEE